MSILRGWAGRWPVLREESILGRSLLRGRVCTKKMGVSILRVWAGRVSVLRKGSILRGGLEGGLCVNIKQKTKQK